MARRRRPVLETSQRNVGAGNGRTAAEPVVEEARQRRLETSATPSAVPEVSRRA